MRFAHETSLLYGTLNHECCKRLLSGALGFSVVKGIRLSDALYFSVVTITTVGYGDIHPTTGMGRLFAVIIIQGGVSTFTVLLANATESFHLQMFQLHDPPLCEVKSWLQ